MAIWVEPIKNFARVLSDGIILLDGILSDNLRAGEGTAAGREEAAASCTCALS